MAAIRNRRKAISDRLIEIDWRDDADHDSTRNPIVEASLAATGAADLSVVDLPTDEELAELVADIELPTTMAAPIEDEAAAIPMRLVAAEPATAVVSVRIDEVFAEIRPYRAISEGQVAESSLLGRSLLAQANAIFNTAFLNLQERYGFTRIYCDVPGAPLDPESDDVTSWAVAEVRRLQRLAA